MTLRGASRWRAYPSIMKRTRKRNKKVASTSRLRMLPGACLDTAYVVRCAYQPHLVEAVEKTGERTTGMHSNLFVSLPCAYCRSLGRRGAQSPARAGSGGASRPATHPGGGGWPGGHGSRSAVRTIAPPHAPCAHIAPGGATASL